MKNKFSLSDYKSLINRIKIAEVFVTQSDNESEMLDNLFQAGYINLTRFAIGNRCCATLNAKGEKIHQELQNI